MPHFIFIQQISVLNILNILYNLLFFSSKCLLFHNATLFGSCNIHILNTGCAKIWRKKKSVAKRLRCEFRDMDYEHGRLIEVRYDLFDDRLRYCQCWTARFLHRVICYFCVLSYNCEVCSASRFFFLSISRATVRCGLLVQPSSPSNDLWPPNADFILPSSSDSASVYLAVL